MASPNTPHRTSHQVESYSLRNMYLSVIVVNLLYFSAGMTLVWTSPMLPVLKTSLQLVPIQEAAVISSFPFGAMLGTAIGALLVGSYGYKSVMWLHIGFSFLSLMLIAFSTSVFCICLGRLIIGIAVGAVLCHTPVYVSQITEPEVRAVLDAISLPTQALGYLLVFALGPQLHYYQLLFLFVPAPVISLACQIWLPESPYFCMAKGRINQTIQTVNFLRRGISSNAAELIVQQIQDEVNNRSTEQSDWFSLISEDTNFLALCQAVGFVSLEQLTGSFLVLMNLHPLLIKAKLMNGSSAELVGVAVFLAVMIAPPITKKLDYKIQLVICNIGMAIAMLVLGLHLFMLGSKHNMILPLGCILLYLTLFHIGFAASRDLLTNRVFSPQFNVLGSLCVQSSRFFFSFLVSYIYYPLAELMGTSCVMWIFTAFSVFKAIYVIYCMPTSSFVNPNVAKK